MSIHSLAYVWGNSKQKGAGLLLMLAIADFADENNECYPSIAGLAQKCRCSTRYVQELTEKLIAAGELEVEIGAGAETPKGRTNLYRVLGVNGGSGVNHSSPHSSKAKTSRLKRRDGVKRGSPVNNGSPRSNNKNIYNNSAGELIEIGSPYTRPPTERKKNYRPDHYADIILGAPTDDQLRDLEDPQEPLP